MHMKDTGVVIYDEINNVFFSNNYNLAPQLRNAKIYHSVAYAREMKNTLTNKYPDRIFKICHIKIEMEY